MPRTPAIIAAACLAALFATGARAQSDDGGSGDRSRWSDMRDDGPGWRHAGHWRDGHDWNDGGRFMRSDRSSDRRDRDGEDSASGDSARSGAGGGARFMLRMGDTRLAVRCGDEEPMKDCVEATMQLMERAHALGRSAPAPSSPPATGSTSPSQP